MLAASPPRRALLRAALGSLALGSSASLLAGCAAPFGQQARGTPAEAIATGGSAVLYNGQGGRGAAVGFGTRHVLTCAHLLEAGATGARLRRADGAEAEAALAGRSARMDLAVLCVPPGFLAAAPRAAELPREGEAVWAAGAPGFGSAIAQGHVEAPDAEMPGFGRGFTARMPALLGYSGGPVVDASGRLMGLTAALPNPGAAGALALLTGADLDGLARRDRQVFVLGIRRAEAEALRLLGRTAA
ncbi:S1 family peptidase [Teichococcus aestuarii]|uniref:S1 family peptidase n=1 Tax=Teichococcus aestuarii TaxID=568898 RepID=UPI00361F05C2